MLSVRHAFGALGELSRASGEPPENLGSASGEFRRAAESCREPQENFRRASGELQESLRRAAEGSGPSGSVLSARC
eukprot:7805319-Alexandrium_andersonii.AAC.1